MRAALIAALATLLITAGPGAAREPDDPRVSLVALLANPAAYDGRRVQVEGFLTLEPEGSGLHLDRTAYEAGLRQNAVWVDSAKWSNAQERRRLSHRYAAVTGVFNANSHGHAGLYSGALQDVQLIHPTLTMADYQREMMFTAWSNRARDLLLAAVPLGLIYLILRRIRRPRPPSPRPPSP